MFWPTHHTVRLHEEAYDKRWDVRAVLSDIKKSRQCWQTLLRQKSPSMTSGQSFFLTDRRTKRHWRNFNFFSPLFSHPVHRGIAQQKEFPPCLPLVRPILSAIFDVAKLRVEYCKVLVLVHSILTAKQFFFHSLQIFRFIFQISRPDLDCYVKVTSCST